MLLIFQVSEKSFHGLHGLPVFNIDRILRITTNVLTILIRMIYLVPILSFNWVPGDTEDPEDPLENDIS